MTQWLDFATFARPNKPNTYFIAPRVFTGAAQKDADAPVFPLPPEALFDRLVGVIEDKGYQQIQTDRPRLAVKFVDVTKLLRFKDDIDMQVVSADGGSSLCIYSRSRLGYSDFGTNKKRISQFMIALQKAVLETPTP